jgi:Cu2+-exporting ATPase
MPPCDHCLLEIGEGEEVPGVDGKLFCCQGCRTVYAFIHDEGMDDFYRRRTWKVEDSVKVDPVAVPEAAAFEEIVREEGGLREIDLYVDGIRCASCIWLVEKILGRTAGVASARVNYATHRAKVRWDPEGVGLEEILARIASTGYLPKPYSESEGLLARKAESRDLLVRFGTAAFLSSQLMIYSVALYAGYFQGMDSGTRRAFEVIALCLTTPVIFYAAWPLVRNTLAGLRRLHFTMDSLIVLGAGSAYVTSLYGLATGGEVYFDTAAMIVTLVLLGRYIEAQAKGRASEAVERLAELSPRQAVKVLVDGDGRVRSRETVKVRSLIAGDCVEVRPGEKFAADGTVLCGESSADESLITGESSPVPKARGSAVIGGSINGTGTLVFEATGTGRETVLARIIAAVEEAQDSRPAIQAVADRAVALFVPFILAAAGLTALFHFTLGSGAEKALMTGISVLVIACPCSLGLATPLAVLVYTGVSSSKGVLVKGGEAAEKAARVREVIFDKTGTLTEGSLTVKDVVPLDSGLTPEESLRLAASLEVHSEHGLGAAIVEAAGGGALPKAASFEALPGRGVRGVVEGKGLFVGSALFMREGGMTEGIGARGQESVEAAGEAGNTVVYLGWGSRVRSLFVLSDGLREEARQAVKTLRDNGVGVSLVSGDGAGATASAAARAGIGRFEAEASPVRKREIVAAMQAGGSAVMMVGDGINDAPALTEALVGVAMGRGTDIARSSADAVLTRNDLRLIPWFVESSRGTFGIIRGNIFWAFFYNTVAIPMAVAGLLHPIVAAGAMAASSLFVVVNSMRIRKFAEG